MTIIQYYRFFTLLILALAITVMTCSAHNGSVPRSAEGETSHSISLPPPKTGGEILAIVPPCALTGNGVNCWGKLSGGLELGPPVKNMTNLAKARNLLRVGHVLCGRANVTESWACHGVWYYGTGLEHYAPSRWIMWLEKLGPNLVDTADIRPFNGHGQYGMSALMADGTVITRVDGVDTRYRAAPGSSIVALQCRNDSPQARGWAVLGQDGIVHLTPTCLGFGSPLSNIAQIDGHRDLLCARSHDGRVFIRTSNAKQTGFDTEDELEGVQDAVNVACNGEAACVVHLTGRVSCTGRIELARPASTFNPPPKMKDVGLEGVRDIWLHPQPEGASHFCASKGSDVLCSSLGGAGELDSYPVRVEGVPEMVDIAVDDVLCGRTDQNGLWCWGAAGPPINLNAAGVRALAVVKGDVFWLTERGELNHQVIAAEDDNSILRRKNVPAHIVLAEAWPDLPQTLELHGTYARDSIFLCAQSNTKARCWSLAPDGSDPQTILIPFAVKSIIPGPPVAAQKVDGSIALLSRDRNHWHNGTQPRGVSFSSAPQLIKGVDGAVFRLTADGRTALCETNDGAFCHEVEIPADIDWVRGWFGLRGTELVRVIGRAPVEKALRVDAVRGTALFLRTIPGSPYVVSFNNLPRGVAGNFGRRGVLTQIPKKTQ